MSSGAVSEAGVWAAPGRVNIIGEHTDYNNGYALPIALNHKATCAVRLRDDETVKVASCQRPRESWEVRFAGLAGSKASGWARYPLGVVHEFHKRGHAVGGLELVIDGDVPVGAGLSSSAAVTCAVAVALRDLFAQELADEDLIDIARAAENDYVGAPTGTLDQSASILCAAGHALLVDFGTGAHVHVPFELEAVGLVLLVIDTNTPHQHADGEYAARRSQCGAAAAQLKVASLREIDDVSRLDALDPVLKRRARHVVTENARVLTAAHVLRIGRDPRTIGAILTEGHASLRDDFEVTVPQLDVAVDAALEAEAHGARMVGGGFGGSVIALVDQASADEVSEAVAARFKDQGFNPPRVFTAVASDGARRIA